MLTVRACGAPTSCALWFCARGREMVLFEGRWDRERKELGSMEQETNEESSPSFKGGPSSQSRATGQRLAEDHVGDGLA